MADGMAQAAAATARLPDDREAPLLDLPHLSRQTFGDPDLEREVLTLFAGQLRVVAFRLHEANGRHALLHTLKGSARGVGALPLAGQAEFLEAGQHDPAALEAFHAVLQRTLAAVARHLG